uniref:Ribosomal protein L32 n=1 Tax=Mesua ferrea TaxID=210380 RepID=A0A6M6CTB7_9ROSI|nr:ribosomal protein L32 [Mesua ferrea]QJX65531.1 ribosomal protein L32 [Mesua ferrea]QKJ81940.1 ribosomal protein L32 [Mesua ferrea]
MSFTSKYNTKKNLFIFEWQFQKNVLLYQKNVFEKIFGKKRYWAALKAFSLAKSLSTGNSKSFFVQQIKNQRLE